MQRYFITEIIENKIVEIIGDDFYHITKVMRMKNGDQVICCDERKTYLMEIIEITNQVVQLRVVTEIIEKPELDVPVTIAQGLIRREKMEEVIAKITALGASSYLPVITERVNIKLASDKINHKWARLNKIAKEAAEQSQRMRLLNVKEPIYFKHLISLASEYDLCLFATVNADMDKSLKIVLQKSQFNNILIFVGPEGGFSDNEETILTKSGFLPVTLGPRVLRTELAPVYIMSAISYEREL